MSISMDHFATYENLPTSVRSGGSPRLDFPYRMQCRSCGFEQLDAVASPARCPKCTGDSWERFAVPGCLVSNGAGRVRKQGIGVKRV